jgi:hypothetical protein
VEADRRRGRWDSAGRPLRVSGGLGSTLQFWKSFSKLDVFKLEVFKLEVFMIKKLHRIGFFSTDTNGSSELTMPE